MSISSFRASVASLLDEGRFDAEYFQPGFVENADSLGRVDTEALPSLASVSDGNHLAVSHDFRSDPNGAVRYLRGQDLGGFVIGDRNPIYIGESTYDRLGRSHICPGDVLLSIVGTVGSLSLVPEGSPPLTGSCKIAILRPKEGKISPEYLAAFLASRHGATQIRRLTRGAVQTGLILADMGRLRVARLGTLENEIASQVAEAERALRIARAQLRDAIDYLPDRWGFVAPEATESLGHATWLNEIGVARRWDAEYYDPQYEAHRRAVLDLPVIKELYPVGRVIASLTNGQTPKRHDLSLGDVRFLTAENVVGFETDFDTEKRVLVAHHEGQLKRTALHQGDVLFTIKGRVGDVSPIAAEPSCDANLNQDVAVLRLRPGTHPYFFAAWFNSCLGGTFVRQRVTGAINPFLGLGTLARLPFPEVDASEQRQIGEHVKALVLQATAAKTQSLNTLIECSELVDQAIANAT